MERRKDKCSCGSTLRCGMIEDGKYYVICVGLGCNKKWEAKRKEDEQLPAYNELVGEFNSGS